MMTSATSADRQVDEEDPVPADVVGQEATQRGADERAPSAEDGAEQALVLAALGGREEVADDRQRDREDGAGAEALDAAEGDELPHLLARGRTASEPSRKRLMPNISIGRRPKRSDSLP